MILITWKEADDETHLRSYPECGTDKAEEHLGKLIRGRNAFDIKVYKAEELRINMNVSIEEMVS